MFVKSLLSDIKKLFLRLIPAYVAISVIVVIARLILFFAVGIAENGNPPMLHSVVSYISYFSMLAFVIAVLTVTVFFIKSAVTSENTVKLPRLAASLLATTIFNVSAQLIFFGASILLTFDGSYFHYYFSALIPPLAYSISSVYGVPLCLYSLLSFCLILSSIPAILSSCFVFGKKFRHSTPLTVCAVLAFYSIALIFFIILVLSDIPRTSLFTGYMYSGDYAHIIATYLAAAISFLFVSLISFFITPFLKNKK